MEHYTFSEMAHMHLTYGEAVGNSHAAARRYAEKFPNRRQRNHKIFFRTDRKLRDSVSFVSNFASYRRP